MAVDVEKLIVSMEARTKAFENALAKASATANKRGREIESRFVKTNKAVSAGFAVAGARLGAGLAGVGVAGIVAGFREIASSVAEIGTEAAQAGLSTKAFQELKFVADQSKVSIDALTDGMKELSLRADEFITTGKGSGAEAFQRLGFSASELATKIKDPSALFTEIIGKLGALDKAAQIRISDEIFGGTGGEQFVKLIAQGEQGIRDQINAANELGIVIDDAVIKRAAEVDRQFGLIATTIGSNLKAAVVDAFTVLSKFVDEYRSVQNQMNSTIDSRIAELGLKRVDLENQRLQSGGSDRLSTRRRGVIDQQLRDLAAEERKLVEERNKRVQLSEVARPADGGGSGSYRGGNSVASSGAAKRADEYKRATAAVVDHIAALQAETEAQRGLAGSLFIL